MALFISSSVLLHRTRFKSSHGIVRRVGFEWRLPTMHRGVRKMVLGHIFMLRVAIYLINNKRSRLRFFWSRRDWRGAEVIVVTFPAMFRQNVGTQNFVPHLIFHDHDTCSRGQFIVNAAGASHIRAHRRVGGWVFVKNHFPRSLTPYRGCGFALGYPGCQTQLDQKHYHMRRKRIFPSVFLGILRKPTEAGAKVLNISCLKLRGCWVGRKTQTDVIS